MEKSSQKNLDSTAMHLGTAVRFISTDRSYNGIKMIKMIMMIMMIMAAVTTSSMITSTDLRMESS